MAVGATLAAYLLAATACGAVADRPPPRPAESCYDRVVLHAARLTDC